MGLSEYASYFIFGLAIGAIWLLSTYIFAPQETPNAVDQSIPIPNSSASDSLAKEPYCGDGFCQNTETCYTCAFDCGKCNKDTTPEADINDLQKLQLETLLGKEIAKKSIVWVKYEYTGKNNDGSYFEKSASGSGVIYSTKNSIITAYTSRHVIDCGYTNDCYQRLTESWYIRTQDGQMHKVSKVYFAPHNLDIAVIQANADNSETYPSAYTNNEVYVGDNVIAIGYPIYAPGGVTEFSVADGKINELKDLVMSDGFGFASIESDAYTNFGSSGGGLFDSKGNLIGINTWKDTNSNSRNIAIKIGVLQDITSFLYCAEGSYPSGNYCVKYCARNEILGSDNNCYGTCTDFYCQFTQQPINDPRCRDSGYILGNDGYCHKPCGYSYCPYSNAICYAGTCTVCPSDMRLFKNRACRYFQ